MPQSPPPPAEIRQSFVEKAGHASQSMGMGRALGQVFAHIYFSPTPQTLDDLTQQLGISKGSASMTVRQLEQWGALKKVWVKGDRKDYYEAGTHFGRIMRKALMDTILQRMAEGSAFLDEAQDRARALGENPGAHADELRFIQSRLKNMATFRDRARWIWDNLLQRLFKS